MPALLLLYYCDKLLWGSNLVEKIVLPKRIVFFWFRQESKKNEVQEKRRMILQLTVFDLEISLS